MQDGLLISGIFCLGVAVGFMLAAVSGVFQLRKRPKSGRLEFDERMK